MRYFGPSLHHQKHICAKGHLSIQTEKKAKVVPVYKNDDETESGNYRPISLLSTFNRIFEKLMYHRLKSYLGKNDILFKSQYGLRENHSRQHAIIDIVNVIQIMWTKNFLLAGPF